MHPLVEAIANTSNPLHHSRKVNFNLNADTELSRLTRPTSSMGGSQEGFGRGTAIIDAASTQGIPLEEDNLTSCLSQSGCQGNAALTAANYSV
jgi:hypothetical protein